MADSLQIQLLGGFAVTLNEQPIRTFRTAKTRALLAYLAVEADRQLSRTSLATLFWGELPDTAAKTNLRIELSNLKSVLASHPALEISRNDVCFHSARASVDVQTFQQAIATFTALPSEAQGAQLASLAAVSELYQGEFLAGLNLEDALEFEDWQLITREALHEQMMLALKLLQTGFAEQGRWGELSDAARRQLALVPWTEAAHRNLMQALAAQGQTQAALAQFERCRTVLQEELGVEPSLATLELAARLRGANSAPAAVQHNLAQQLKSFVGRNEELTQLRALVQTEKLVTVLGIGGVGKSHLVQTVAQNVLRDFADGVWFVPLANSEAGEAAADRIALAIAAAVGFQVTDMQLPLAQLVAHLADKKMLLVLDNWEHVAEAAPLVLEPLLHETRAHILATSRMRLMIEGEHVVELAGLTQTEAFTLFVERARRIVPTFVVDAAGAGHDAALGQQVLGQQALRATRDEIQRICEQVAGLPLGIELAASWIEHYSVAEISQSIRAVAVQPQRTAGLLHRHHSLSSVFEFSWQLLSPRQQQILACISVFRGGFDRSAATMVAESALNDLSVLIAHSLLQRVTAGRYGLHPLIQEFAASKLAAAQPLDLHTRFAHHYLHLLATTPHTQWMAQLRVDYENIRSAWQRATEMQDAKIVEDAVVFFGDFMREFGLMQDGNDLFAAAAAQFEQDTTLRELVAVLLDQQSYFLRGIGGLKATSVLHRRILTFTADLRLQEQAHMELANFHAELGEWEQADFHFARSEAVAEESGDVMTYVYAVENRVFLNALHFRGNFAAGIVRLQELLTLLDAVKADPATIASAAASLREDRLRTRIVQSLNIMAIRYGDYALSLRYTQLGLELTRDGTNRQRRNHLLLDAALAEQFAGLYDRAIAHNLEALAGAEEIDDLDDIGLLNANLCLTLRQSGAWDEALAYGLEAIKRLIALGSRRIEGQARNRVGHTLSVMGRWDEAYATYGEALVVWATMQHPNRYEAVAGRAAAAFHLGKPDEALSLVEETLAFVADQGLIGIVEPVRLLLNCNTVLGAMGQGERARQTLEQAHAWVQTIANRISDDTIRQSFLHNRPDNQLLYARLASVADSLSPAPHSAAA